MPLSMLLPLLVQILGLAERAAEEAPKIIEHVRAIWDTATGQTPATADELAQYEAAEAAAYDALLES